MRRAFAVRSQHTTDQSGRKLLVQGGGPRDCNASPIGQLVLHVQNKRKNRKDMRKNSQRRFVNAASNLSSPPELRSPGMLKTTCSKLGWLSSSTISTMQRDGLASKVVRLLVLREEFHFLTKTYPSGSQLITPDMGNLPFSF